MARLVRIQNLTRIVLAWGLLIAARPGIAADAPPDPILIREVIPFSEDVGGRKAVVTQCDPGTEISEAVRRRAGKAKIAVSASDADLQDVPGRALTMRITNVPGGGGGSLGGTKSIIVRGELRQEGEVVASFVTLRSTKFKIIPRKTCSLFAEAADILARDIVKWLKSPKLKARLGEA